MLLLQSDDRLDLSENFAYEQKLWIHSALYKDMRSFVPILCRVKLSSFGISYLPTKFEQSCLIHPVYRITIYAMRTIFKASNIIIYHNNISKFCLDWLFITKVRAQTGKWTDKQTSMLLLILIKLTWYYHILRISVRKLYMDIQKINNVCNFVSLNSVKNVSSVLCIENVSVSGICYSDLNFRFFWGKCINKINLLV